MRFSSTWKNRLMRKNSSPNRRAPWRTFRPRLELLEDRTLLSPYLVTTTADTGAGSLRDAINQTNADTNHALYTSPSNPNSDEIDFAIPTSDPGYNATTGSYTITLTSGELLISQNVNIVGPGANQVAVSGNGASRVFDIGSGVTVSISGLTIENCHSSYGGGIYNAGTLTVSASTLSSNTGDLGGGGIYNVGALTVSGSTFTGNSDLAPGNTASFQPPSGYWGGGGGIYNSGSLSVSGSTFSNNASVHRGGGGGIKNYVGGTLVVSNCTFSNNTADFSAGGGIFNAGGTLVDIRNSTFTGNTQTAFNNLDTVSIGDSTSLGTVSVSECTFVGNSEQVAFGGGGGITNAGRLTVSDSTFANNTTAGWGGGIFNYQGSATVANSTFTGNFSTAGGGGINNLYQGQVTVISCTLSGNSASSPGGGINNTASLTIQNTIIAGNTAGSGPDVSGLVTSNGYNLVGNSSGSSGFGAAGDLVGGGANPIIDPLLAPLGNYGGPTQTMALLPGSPAIDAGSNALAVDASGNPLTTDQRGQPRVYNGTVDIGAFEYQPATLTVTNTNDVGPGSLREVITAANNLGAVDGGTNTITFAIPTSDPGYNPATGSFTITLTSGELLVSQNVNIVGPGANQVAVSGNAASRVFDISSGVTATISRLTIENCHYSYGGGIYNAGTLTVSASTVSSNTGDLGGGGIYNVGSLTVSDSTFSGNTDLSPGNSAHFQPPSAYTGGGGGIYNSGSLWVSGSTFSNNSSVYNGGGGGIKNYDVGATLWVSNSTFSDNSAVAGGGIFNAGGTLIDIRNSTFSGNSSVGSGGAINNLDTVSVSDNTSLGTVSVSGCTFVGNYAGGFGGGAGITNAGTLTVRDSTFANNATAGGGGGIFNWMGWARVANSTFTGNSSTNGGGIFNLYRGWVTIISCTLSGSSSSSIGGGISNAAGLTTQNTIIAGNTAGSGPDVSGVVTSNGYNLVGNSSGSSGFGAAGDLVGGGANPIIDPLLAPLGNYGGPTQTMALLPGSPAIDAGSNALAVDASGNPLPYDQRGPGFPRIYPANGTVDIGAFESQGLSLAGIIQQVLSPSYPVTVQAITNRDAVAIISAVNQLPSYSGTPVTVALNLAAGVSYSDIVASPPPGVTLVINGSGGTTIIVGHSPALTVSSGNVIVTGLTLTTATDAPTILVTGGNLTLRNDVVQESTGFTDAAIAITGGTVDLGTAASPGGNILNVNGTGEFVHNTTGNLVPAVGDTFESGGVVLTSSTLTFTALTASVNPSTLNQAVTVTATARANGSSGTPSGSIDFFDVTINTDLGRVALSAGMASLTTSTLVVGNHAIVASYSGDSTFLPSLDKLTQAVHYNFSGFLPPLKQNMAFGLNRTIPIKFQLTDYNGAFISSLSAVTSLQVAPVNADGSLGTPFNPTPTGGTSLRNDGNQYIFSWQTKGLSAGYYEILLTLNDGTLKTKILQLTASSAGAQVANGSTATATTGALLGGDVELYVDNSSGLFPSDELARINDAVAAVDATLAPYGVTITEVTDSSLANVTLDTGSTSAVGGYVDGVLGCWNPAGEITLIQGWNWYAGSDPTQIGAGQYDFQTTVTHELGHALGLGESSDPTSAMYASLATGTVIRNLTTADLAIPYTGTGADAVHAAVPTVLASVTLERTRLEPGTINFFVSGAATRPSNTAAVLLASPQDRVAARLDTLRSQEAGVRNQESGAGGEESVTPGVNPDAWLLVPDGTGAGENGILPGEEGADDKPPDGLPPLLDTGASPGVEPAAPGASAVEARSPAAELPSAVDAYFADERWTEAGNNGSATVPWVAAEDTDLACLRLQRGGSPAIAAATLAVVLSGYVAQPTKRERRTTRHLLLKRYLGTQSSSDVE